MKIAISYKPSRGSWGGGNQFVQSLVKGANDEDYKIVYDLKQNDIDIILLTDPRSFNQEITLDLLIFLIIYYVLIKMQLLFIGLMNVMKEKIRDI